MRIRRWWTDTPLTRRHRHRRKNPPFKKFDPAQYPAAARELAARAQCALAAGEYSAVDLFAHIASALSLNGAPFDLVAEAARIPADEIRHAELALTLASLLVERDVSFEIDRAPLEQRWRTPVDQDRLDRLMLEVPAIGETLAGALLIACQRQATDPVARAVFTSIVADEVHHARLGWYYLAWRSPRWSRAERQRAADRAGEMVADVENRFWVGRDAPRGAKSAARALGVLDSPTQRRVVRAVMEDEIVPALDALGLGASHAWKGRRRRKDR
jgi:hypothetical protein